MIAISRNRIIPALLTMVMLLGLLIVVPATPAEASLACSGTSIQINTNPGAEAPSWATGHSHWTGNHYIYAIYMNGNWEWWADNNGGWDGDTWDTYYGLIAC